jgi:glycerol-3-phosphate dehydrogenase
VNQIERLLGRYGSLIDEVLALIADDPTLAQPLPGGADYLRAESVYAVTHEGARHLEDVLARRTRISIESWDRGTEAAAMVAELIGDRLGWGAERRRTEVENYLERVHAELESQRQPDDSTADAVRLAAPDIVPVTG